MDPETQTAAPALRACASVNELRESVAGLRQSVRLLDAAIEDMASGLTVLEQRVVVLEAERDAYRDRYTRLIQSRVEDPAEETRP